MKDEKPESTPSRRDLRRRDFLKVSGSIIVCFVALAATISASSRADELRLPDDSGIPRWSRTGKARHYRGKNLYGYIDGGAELFLELGFQELVLQKYRAGRSELAVEAYRMDSPESALAVYLAKCGKETPAPGLDGNLMLNPTWSARKQLITVHPLGGCPMGDDEAHGVVDTNGEVFHYPNLFVTDASIIPTAVGPNPSKTIGAMAERISQGIVERGV